MSYTSIYNLHKDQQSPDENETVYDLLYTKSSVKLY